MRLLVDANIFLELLLDQEKANQAEALLAKTDQHEFFVSVFSVHAVGVSLFRRKRHDDFRIFLSDMIVHAATTVITLAVEDMDAVIRAYERFSLDFDDAYQYAAAEKYDLTIVSFDADFDRTKRGRKTPEVILAQ